MNTELDVKFVARKVWQDTMRDGLMELFMGLYMLLTGIIMMADLSALFILLLVFFPPVVKKMKERYTHPRIGYVKSTEADKGTGRKILAALVGGVIALALVVLLSIENEKTQALYQWVPLLPALILAAVLFIIGRRTGFLRYYLMLILSLVAGAAIPLLGLTERMDSIVAYLLIMGPVLLLWGVVVFLTFLRTYPVRAEEAG